MATKKNQSLEDKFLKGFGVEATITQSYGETEVIAVAVHKRLDANSITKVATRGGIPIGGYVRDGDAWLIVRCFDQVSLGNLSFTLKLTMKNIPGWEIQIPVPMDVVRKTIDQDQKRILDTFENTYPASEGFSIQLVQLISKN